MLVPEIVAAGGGLLFAFDHATIAGKLVLTLLAIVSIFSWSIMITKLRVIRFARKQNARFLAAFRQDRQPLRLFEKNARKRAFCFRANRITRNFVIMMDQLK